MENTLGRYLESNEVVHHKDGNKNNNSIDNLEVMTRGNHTKHHNPEPAYLILICNSCGIKFTRRANQRAAVKGYYRQFCSRSCFYKN